MTTPTAPKGLTPTLIPLVECARAMFEMIDDQLSPTNEDGTVHVCGPDANCDASCADRAAFADMMSTWNDIITRAENTPPVREAARADDWAKEAARRHYELQAMIFGNDTDGMEDAIDSLASVFRQHAARQLERLEKENAKLKAGLLRCEDLATSLKEGDWNTRLQRIYTVTNELLR